MVWMQSTRQSGLERGFGRSKLLSGQTDNLKFKQVDVLKFERLWTNVVLTHRFWTIKLGGSPSCGTVPPDLLIIPHRNDVALLNAALPFGSSGSLEEWEWTSITDVPGDPRLLRRGWAVMSFERLRVLWFWTTIGARGRGWELWPGNGNMAFPLNWLSCPFGSSSYKGNLLKCKIS